MRRLSAARVFCFSCCALLLSAACSEPPRKEIDRAQGAIDAARAAGAEQYAAAEYKAAADALQQSYDAVQQRDYRLALARALDANERALEAAKAAGVGRAQAHSEAERTITATSNAINQLRERVKAAEAARAPAKQVQAARRAIADANRSVQEARAALKEGNYAAATAAMKAVTDKMRAELAALEPGSGPRRRR